MIPNYSKNILSMDLNNDVELFKGHGDDKSQTTFDVVHRLSRIEESGESRIVLIIDTPQEGWHFD